MTEYRGHQFTIDRAPYWAWGAPWRTIRVPSLGITEEVCWGYRETERMARWLIDRHIAEHGDAPGERKPMTDEDRAELYRETFGRF